MKSQLLKFSFLRYFSISEQECSIFLIKRLLFCKSYYCSPLKLFIAKEMSLNRYVMPSMLIIVLDLTNIHTRYIQILAVF